jgi:hypothetical protein
VSGAAARAKHVRAGRPHYEVCDGASSKRDGASAGVVWFSFAADTAADRFGDGARGSVK